MLIGTLAETYVQRSTQSRSVDALFDALEKGNAPIALRLVDQGLDVNVAEPHTGQTALMHAAASGNTDLASELLKRGGDPNRVDNSGLSAKAYAKKNGDRRMVALLSRGRDY
jgi:ankyrin repeat protein